MNLKQILNEKLTENELQLLKRSFDVIGDIVIIEVPKELSSKKKLIGQAMLEQLKNVNYVYKKKGGHYGKFRRQKLELIADRSGKKKTETTYVESGCRLKLDVEKCYFSPRLSNERLRISKLVERGEKILVMFSGVGVYPTILAKNSQAKLIVGIELNPEAHKYATENIKLNKVDGRVVLYKGDVKKIINNLGMTNIGIKSNWKEPALSKRLKTRAKIIEFHLDKGDLENKFNELKNTIKKLQNKQVRVMIHQPTHYLNKEIILGSKKDYETVRLSVKRMLDLIKRFSNCQGIIMQPNVSLESKNLCTNNELKENLLKLKEELPELFDKLYLENVFLTCYSKAKDIEEVVDNVELKNICIDTAHFRDSKQTNEEMIEFIDRMKKKINIYFHIADSTGIVTEKTDCVNLGKGNVNFKKLAELMDFGIIETISKNEKVGKEIIQDYKYFSKLKKPLFDRIIMPLPKGSEDFLENTFSASKKGTKIHLYQFCKEKEFDKLKQKMIKKCEKLGKKITNIQIIKAGQHAPRTYRVSIDFEISK